VDWHIKEPDVIDLMRRNGSLRDDDSTRGVDDIPAGDYFVDGHPLAGHPKPKRELYFDDMPGAYERIIRGHHGEDRKRCATESGVDKAMAHIKAGRRTLAPEQFESVARFMFQDFPRMRREALRSGKLKLGDGSSVIRGEAKAKTEAA
jgi:hypothetical protein